MPVDDGSQAVCELHQQTAVLVSHKGGSRPSVLITLTLSAACCHVGAARELLSLWICVVVLCVQYVPVGLLGICTQPHSWLYLGHGTDSLLSITVGQDDPFGLSFYQIGL